MKRCGGTRWIPSSWAGMSPNPGPPVSPPCAPARVGRPVPLPGGAGLGGVLEPLQASPTIIEDNCFIGARAEVAEGVIVGEGSVLSMGVYLSGSTKIVDRASGEIFL